MFLESYVKDMLIGCGVHFLVEIAFVSGTLPQIIFLGCCSTIMRRINTYQPGPVTLSFEERQEIQNTIRQLHFELAAEKSKSAYVNRPHAVSVLETENAQLKRLNVHLQLQIDQVTRATNAARERLSFAYRASEMKNGQLLSENGQLTQIIALQDEKNALTVSRYERKIKEFQDRVAQLEAQLDGMIGHARQEVVPSVSGRQASNSSLLNWMSPKPNSTEEVKPGVIAVTPNASFR